MDNIIVLLVAGGLFALSLILQSYILNKLARQREERMTRNMIKAIEKLEWSSETNGRTEKESYGRDKKLCDEDL